MEALLRPLYEPATWYAGNGLLSPPSPPPANALRQRGKEEERGKTACPRLAPNNAEAAETSLLLSHSAIELAGASLKGLLSPTLSSNRQRAASARQGGGEGEESGPAARGEGVMHPEK